MLGRPIQSLEDDMAGNTVILAPPAAPSGARRGAGATRTVARVSHLRTATGLTLTLTPPNGSHTHISHPGPPLPPCRMAPSSCQHLDPPLPHLTCLRERPNLHMGTRTMRGWPRAWAVSYTQSRCITWALPERPEMLDTLLFSIKKTHEISPGVRRSCPPRGCYPVTTGRGYGHLGVS